MYGASCACLHAILRGAALVAVSLMLFLLIGAPASAASFTIDPLKVELSAARSSAVMRLQNDSAETLTIQVQPKRWRQEGQADRLEVSRDVVATPPIFRVRPGASQFVRIALLAKPDPVTEIAYRLVFDEIPPPPAEDFVGVQVATRISIPLFVVPSAPARPVLKLSLKPASAGGMAIAVQNAGTVHAHIRRMIIESRSDPSLSPVRVDTPVYILPGSTREVALPVAERLPGSPDRISIKAFTPAGPVEFDGSIRP